MRNKSVLLLPAVLLLACGGAGASAATTVKTDSTADSTKAAAAKRVAAAVAAAPRHSFDTAAAAGMRPLVRETYQYQGTDRDPFRPLITPVNQGPELPDLRLVAIIYDGHDAAGSIATFRDIGNDHRYTLSPGQRLGRLSVVSINANAVKLRQDDFGTEREQTYSLRKPEDEKP